MSNDDRIVSAAIYPPIGICRIGNAEGHFLGPEVNEPAAAAPGFYRDGEGRLLRQAARFRIYGLDKDGVAVKELTAAEAEITWTVEVANLKSEWYQFQVALDIPEAHDAAPSMRRNADVTDRAALRITPSPKTISGCDAGGPGYAFDDGAFMGTPVYLGEVMTDAAGRLIVLGGKGVSASYDGTVAISFGNNESWHDDTSDGPVDAHVVYQGAALPVAPAWVVTAPPNYGPQLKSVRTMWDLMRDTAISAKMMDRPAHPSFQEDIRPIFQRLTDLQWANQAFAEAFGHAGAFNVVTPDQLARLADPGPEAKERRRVLSNSFRRFDTDAWSPKPWPWLYGDAMSVPTPHTPRAHAALSDLQLAFLDQWAAGDFEADYDPNPTPPAAIEDVPVADQPAMLTRAAMEFCLADAFHPGCEMTWPMRHATMYAEPFRLNRLPKDLRLPSYGAQLSPTVMRAANGPLQGGQFAGSITRWMAVPWQTDTASCRGGYNARYDPFLPTFWPARVPNQVLTLAAYETVMDESADMTERLKAFAERTSWDAPLDLSTSSTYQVNRMVDHFDEMGVLEVLPGPADDPRFPSVMQVSDQAVAPKKPEAARLAALPKDAASGSADWAETDKAKRFPKLV